MFYMKIGKFVYGFVVRNDEIVFSPILKTAEGMCICALFHEVRNLNTLTRI